ncbi:putative oxidoreductase [Gordonia terrae NBRC 100016]|uniref:Oxidoreductase n=1 Tax=Gordonia terrae NBRC 100016 TaxID=1089454 RepID=A0ABQ0HLJ5_9ACTN|nr:putative oxidoreductase [Gordonia terrae NBRC 100016]VTS58694.1 3-alpha-hydroxysteroid dehydrogenase/carbonyl reductase [Gordonia terrae]
MASTAGFRWPSHIEELTNLIVEETSFDLGAAWFAASERSEAAYSLSKEAVTIYTLHRALYYAKRGLRINAVLPGPVQTPILGDFEATMGKSLLDSVKSLFGRHATPQEVADVVIFLVSPNANWVNGQAIAVDRGISAAWASGVLTPPR